MRPDFTQLRGSGASPRKRGAGRASTSWKAAAAMPSRTSCMSRTAAGSKWAAKVRAVRVTARSSSGSALGAPLRQPAVEDHDVGRAHDLERPPDPRRRGEADAVVDDDLLFLVDAERADRGRELPRRRQHVGQGIAGVGDRVDIEEDRARDVCGVVFLRALAPAAGQVPAAVDHDDRLRRDGRRATRSKRTSASGRSWLRRLPRSGCARAGSGGPCSRSCR